MYPPIAFFRGIKVRREIKTIIKHCHIKNEHAPLLAKAKPIRKMPNYLNEHSKKVTLLPNALGHRTTRNDGPLSGG